MVTDVLEDFLALLRAWRIRGAVWFDDDEVIAPHAGVTGFDLDGLGRLAQRLRVQATATAGALDGLAEVSDGVPLSWSGLAGAQLQTAAARLAVDLGPAAAVLSTHATSASAAHEILTEVVDDYRSIMNQVAGPVAATTALPEVREELSARLDLAAAAGDAASAAVADSVGALHAEWRSAGELVLAGDR